MTAPAWIWVFAPMLAYCAYLVLNANDLTAWDEAFMSMATIIVFAAYLPFAAVPLTMDYLRHR